MAFLNHVFDFADFHRFSCYEMFQNSDFFEETIIDIFDETFLVIFKHSANVQAELLSRPQKHFS